MYQGSSRFPLWLSGRDGTFMGPAAEMTVRAETSGRNHFSIRTNKDVALKCSQTGFLETHCSRAKVVLGRVLELWPL